jgi:predicted AlkP superfamily pyrophosphatase or phosphodiesterase
LDSESHASRGARVHAWYGDVTHDGMARWRSVVHVAILRYAQRSPPIVSMHSSRDQQNRSECFARRLGSAALRLVPLSSPRAALWSVLALALGCTPVAVSTRTGDTGLPSAARARPYVVLVSLDAFRHDYLDRYHPAALEGLAARGVRARALIPPFPSKTFPSHYTIATGLYPGHHGIIGNNFYDSRLDRWFRVKDTTAVRDGVWYAGEPIWLAAEREGVRSAVYFWPGSEAEVHGMRPSFYKRYRGTVPDSQRVDESIAWLRLPAERRPHLVMLYLSTADDTTHAYGPETPHTAVAVASLNRTVQRLIDSVAASPLRDSVNVIVLSDHGMADAPQDRVIPIRPLLAAEGIDTTHVRTGDIGPTMSLWFAGDTALARRTLTALARRLTHAHAYARGETPARWHLDGNERAGDLIVVGDLGYVIAASARDRWLDHGSHGWDPGYEEMHGIFIAAGPEVRQAGIIPAFDNVHVFPFLAALLGLDRAPRTDGDARVLAPILKTQAPD